MADAGWEDEFHEEVAIDVHVITLLRTDALMVVAAISYHCR